MSWMKYGRNIAYKLLAFFVGKTTNVHHPTLNSFLCCSSISRKVAPSSRIISSELHVLRKLWRRRSAFSISLAAHVPRGPTVSGLKASSWGSLESLEGPGWSSWFLKGWQDINSLITIRVKMGNRRGFTNACMKYYVSKITFWVIYLNPVQRIFFIKRSKPVQPVATVWHSKLQQSIFFYKINPIFRIAKTNKQDTINFSGACLQCSKE